MDLQTKKKSLNLAPKLILDSKVLDFKEAKGSSRFLLTIL